MGAKRWGIAAPHPFPLPFSFFLLPTPIELRASRFGEGQNENGKRRTRVGFKRGCNSLPLPPITPRASVPRGDLAMALFFEFERLDVYQLALDYQVIADEIATSPRPGEATFARRPVAVLVLPSPNTDRASRFALREGQNENGKRGTGG